MDGKDVSLRFFIVELDKCLRGSHMSEDDAVDKASSVSGCCRSCSQYTVDVTEDLHTKALAMSRHRVCFTCEPYIDTIVSKAFVKLSLVAFIMTLCSNGACR